MELKYARKISWISYFSAISILCILPFVMQLPMPYQAMVLNTAEFYATENHAVEVTLPHRWLKRAEENNTGTYVLDFSLDQITDEPLYLFIPNLKKRLQGHINGQYFYDSSTRVSWAGPLIQITDLVQIPQANLQTGNHHLQLSLDTIETLPSILSEVYIGPKHTLVPYFKKRVWINERLLAMSYATQLLLSVGLLAAFAFRRQDILFGWLGLTVGLSALYGVGIFVDVIPGVIHLYPSVFLLGPSIGGISILFALSLLGRPGPKLLIWVVVLAPFVLYAVTHTGWFITSQLGAFLAMPILIIGFMIAACIIFFGAWYERNIEALLILGPWLLIVVYMLHDLAMSIGAVSGNSFTNHSVRTIFITFIVIVLMRRLSSSLNTIDRNEDVLHTRLAEQEATLDADFAKQTIQVKQTTIDTERQRLISDLHDGMGGHLVSILAMTENPESNNDEIYHVAQRALNDLRMVIYSLDIDGGDLSYVLALYRDQINPVLANLGINTQWSMLNFPEISGTSPSNVLTVLRILQEALTNAQKHGAPKSISIVGISGPNNTALLVVENTGGKAFQESLNSRGYGLKNMQSRALSIGGKITIETLSDGARFTLQLPIQLPKVEE